MPRNCSICSHPARDTIDEMLINGTPLRKILEQCSGISMGALHRHKSQCITEVVVAAQHERAVATGDELMDQITNLNVKATAILDNAIKKKDGRLSLAAIREVKGVLELVGKVTGRIQSGSVVNVISNPVWLNLRVAILDALENHPEAKQDVLKAISETSNGD